MNSKMQVSMTLAEKILSTAGMKHEMKGLWS